MYSVVLAMALAGSAEAPDCHCCQAACGCQGMVSTGCFGGCMGIRTGCGGGCVGVRVGCNGGYVGGCIGNRVGCQGCTGGVIVVPVTPATPMPGEKLKDPKKKEASIATPATIIVSIPADAKLTIDGYQSTQTSSQRYLVTPPLQPGQEFTYTLVAETMNNGQPVSQQQVVTVRAGHQTPVSFNFNTTPTTTSR